MSGILLSNPLMVDCVCSRPSYICSGTRPDGSWISIVNDAKTELEVSQPNQSQEAYVKIRCFVNNSNVWGRGLLSQFQELKNALEYDIASQGYCLITNESSAST
jgi:hypothetical protein